MAIYAETGSAVAASRITGIPDATIYHWCARTEEGEAVVTQLRQAIRANAAWAYVEIVGKAQQEVMNRLERGDPHVLKDGSIVYTPVKARDAMVIAAMAQDKLASLAGGLGGTKGAGAALERLASALIKRLEAPSPEARDTPPPIPNASAYLG